MTNSDEPTISRRRLLASAGASVAALGTIPVVHQGAELTRPAIVGHRGVAGLEAPNTIAGVRLAEELGADGVALDVRQTADGTLVLFHDPVLDISTNASGRIETRTVEELADVRVDGEPIPTLREALRVVEETDLSLYLELKKLGYTDETLALLDEFGLESRTTLTSFRQGALTGLGETPIDTGYLAGAPHPDLFAEARQADSSLVLSHYVPYGLEWFVEEANHRDMRPGIWELASTEAHIEDSLSYDIDLLVTNRPDIALEKVR